MSEYTPSTAEVRADYIAINCSDEDSGNAFYRWLREHDQQVRAEDRGDHTPVRGVRVPDDLWNAAQQKARARGDSLSQVIREAIRKYVNEGGR